MARRRLDDHLHFLKTSCSEREALKVHCRVLGVGEHWVDDRFRCSGRFARKFALCAAFFVALVAHLAVTSMPGLAIGRYGHEDVWMDISLFEDNMFGQSGTESSLSRFP